MQTITVNEQKPSPAWKSPWVIAWISLIFVVVGVNGVMVYFAATTNPGLVVEDFYERGQNYERTLLSKRASNPGWIATTDIPGDVSAGAVTPIRFFLTDKAGQPVTPEQVVLFAYRPSDADRDFRVAMQEEGPGRYVAQVAFPLVGVWDTLIEASAGDFAYPVGQRIQVLSARPSPLLSP